MNLFLGPIPDSPIGARLFEVVFPPRTPRPVAVIHFPFPISHVEARQFKAALYARWSGPRPFDWARDDPDLA